MILKFASGAVGTFILSDAVPSPYSFEAGTGEIPMITYTGQDFHRIFGTQASLSVPNMQIWNHANGKKI